MLPNLHLSLAALATLASVASAHTVFTTLSINGKSQGDGTCIRMPMDPGSCTDPIAGLNSDDMVCGRDGLKAVAFTCPAAAGAELAMEFREWADGSNAGSIDGSHKGPCSVYLKAVSNMKTDSAAGGGWFKIWEDGYDEATKQWCTEKLIADGGHLRVNIPDSLPSGYYLVRPELLALQEADKGDPQFYVGCGQLFVTGTAGGPLKVPEENSTSIPGHVAADDASVTFNIWKKPMALPYKIPGPRPYLPASAAGHNDDRTLTATRRIQTEGLVPDSCLIKNANWCGHEVRAYSDEKGCWAASEDCFEQQGDCYVSAPPTGSRGCDRWGDKCNEIQEACASGNFHGPPNAGQKLA